MVVFNFQVANEPMKAILLLFLLCLTSSAQKRDVIRIDWVTKDVEAIERLLPELARTDPTLESLEKLFGKKPEQVYLGFGARTFRFFKGNGYTTFSVRGFEFDGKVGYYTIAVSGSSSWNKVKNILIQRWTATAPLDFKEGDSSIYHYREHPNVVASYKDKIKSQLGELKSVSVPPPLDDGYTYLISLGNNSVIGSGGCNYGGVTPRGKTAIDQILAAGRIDLIENILKGYNPGGRVYALLALLKIQQDGTLFSDQTQKAMTTILNLDLEMDTCNGCEHMDKTAKRIVSDWQWH